MLVIMIMRITFIMAMGNNSYWWKTFEKAFNYISETSNDYDNDIDNDNVNDNDKGNNEMNVRNNEIANVDDIIKIKISIIITIKYINNNNDRSV